MKTNYYKMLFGVAVLLYFIKILSGSRNNCYMNVVEC
jgi:hypothetical protein